jgi:SNF2 family DNA or RNA helicase
MMLHAEVSRKHKMVVIPHSPEVAAFFPHAKRFDFNGAPHLAIPHGVEETQLLRNINVTVPAPILAHYDWPGGRKPFEVQRKTAAMMTTYPRMHCLNGMGTGKTRTTLWCADFLMDVGMINKALVVAPLSTLQNVWEKEIFEVLYAKSRSCVVLYGDRKKRLKLLGMDADFYIVNHDGVGVIYEELEKRTDIDCFILDEAAVYRNNQAKRTKAMRKLAEPRKYVWGLTGSPTPNEPTDAFAQSRIVTPWNVAGLSFTTFKERVQYKVGQWQWMVKPDAADTVASILSPSVRFSLDDVTELPDVVYRHQDVALSAKQAAVYQGLVKNMLAQLGAGEVSAVNKGVLLSKLLQTACGWVYGDNGAHEIDPGNNPRLDALIDTIEATDRKVLIFAPYVHAVNGILAAVNAAGHQFEAIYGDVSQPERVRIFNRFKADPKLKGIVAHPQTMAHGLTLTEADTIVWYCPTTSLEIFEQANARIRRIGQKHKQQVVMLGGTPVERKVYTKLEKKQQFLNDLLGLIQSETDATPLGA